MRTTPIPGSPTGPRPEAGWASPSDRTRLVSLDAARGTAIAAMLIMNHPGNWEHTYAFLQHAEWHGWTLTDLVFPIFLFVVGVSMPFSFGRLLGSGASRRQVMVRAARRAAVLFVLGLGLVTFPWWQLSLGEFRIPGVLQRIALCFLFATPVVLWLRIRGQALAAAALLLGYWALMAWVPVPGVGPGVWEPGLDLASYVDRAVLGTNHMWPGQDWDPLGLLGTLPATGSVLLGALAGHLVHSRRTHRQVIAWLVLAGGAGIMLGWFWGIWFPINKPLWTSSYTLFAAGWGAILLGLYYWLLEARGHRTWARPLAALGVNAIFIYVVASLADAIAWRVPIWGGHSVRHVVYRVFFESWLPPVNASLAFALAFLGIWILIALVLERRGIRIKV